MLKRKASFPSLSSFEAPLSDFPLNDLSSFNYRSKRRRIAAPELDGRVRGLNVDDEEHCDESKDQTSLDVDEVDDQESLGWQDQADSYKGMNSLLHQLHLEHQLRATHLAYACSSQATIPQESPSFQRATPAYTSLQFTSSMPSLHCSEGQRTTQPVLAHQEPPYKPEYELDSVRANYEGMNKVLGSIVRQRLEEHGCDPARQVFH